MVRFTGRASKPDCTANASVQLDTILAHARRLHRRCTVEGSQLVLHKSLRTQWLVITPGTELRCSENVRGMARLPCRGKM